MKDERTIFDEVREITITKDEYDYLSSCFWDLKLIKDALFNYASLSWSGNRLSIDTDVLNKVISLVAPETYKDTLKRLQREEKEAAEAKAAAAAKEAAAKEEEKNESDSSEK